MAKQDEQQKIQDTISEVKRSLEIAQTNDTLDLQLIDFVSRISQQLCVRLGFVQIVPDALGYIVVECTIKRFNRKSNEGMETYSQEGESISYSNLLDEFEDDINAWKNNQDDETNAVPRKGVARFL